MRVVSRSNVLCADLSCGDVELIDVDGNRVVLALRGICTSCPSAGLTKGGIESKLKELVDPDLVVEEVAA